MTTVVDASAYLDLLLDVVPVERRGLFDGELVAPGIFLAEVASGLASCERRGIIDRAFAEVLLGELTASPVATITDRVVVERAFALRANLRLYDACYVAVAELVGGRLLTADARLARAPGLTVPIVVV